MSGTVVSGFASAVGMAPLALSQLPIRGGGGRHLKAIVIQSTAQLLHQLGSPLPVLLLSLAHCKLLRLIELNLFVAKRGVFPSPGLMHFTPYLPLRERGLISVFASCAPDPSTSVNDMEPGLGCGQP